MRRRWVAAAMIVVTVALPAPAALAHGGAITLDTTIGPYRVQGTDAVVQVRDVTATLCTLTLRHAETGLPVDDATITANFRAGTLVRSELEAARLGNEYNLLIRDPGVREWAVEIRIDGPLGTITMSNLIDGAGYPGTLRLDVWGVVAALLVGFAYMVARARRAGPPVNWKGFASWATGTGLIALALWLPPRWAPPLSTSGGLDARAIPLLIAAPLLALGWQPWMVARTHSRRSLGMPWLAAIALAIGSWTPLLVDLQLRYPLIYTYLRVGLIGAMVVGWARWLAHRRAARSG